jgi:hypothetical protein
MIDRQVVKEFIEDEFKDMGIKMPSDISKDALVETFCRYTEDDYYEWLKDNFKSFFIYNDWDWIKMKIEHYSNY